MQLLYEQMGSEADPSLASPAAQLQDLASSCPQVSALGPAPVAVRTRHESVLKVCHFIPRISSSWSRQVLLESPQPESFLGSCCLPDRLGRPTPTGPGGQYHMEA